jgi:RsiW-degrading membrane proteinase PrsW (M82 family)
MKEALRILIPIGSWLHNPSWRQGWRLLFSIYALLPLVFLILFASSSSQSAPGWVYSLYIAPLWAFAFWYLIRPGPVNKLVVQVGVAVIVWTVAWISVITGNIDGALNPAHFFEAIGVGLNEEITKALPIFLAGILLLKYRSTKLDVRMWMFLGTIAGLVFGVVEAAGYTALYLNSNISGQVVLLEFAERVFVDGFQHAIWAGISAFFIGIGLNYPRRRVQLVILGVSIAALLHALNDWTLGALHSQALWIAIQAFSLFLFLGYTISSSAIERAVRDAPLFRGGTGPQTFAGQPSPAPPGPAQ